ncbi:MAG: FadR/GntR family transcriptional regulator [Microbacterium sp.]|uniref:FadR/GntR family transcriptional regulator n=1 Tax=Microbacterium sp. TaxID=51671 RepID=UPI0039E5BDA0
MSFEPSRVLRPRQQVETQLRAAILDGIFAEGSRLPNEIDLAASFGVSRATVREALRSLADEGLVRKSPGARGGTFVQALSATELSDRLRAAVDAVMRLGVVSLEEMIEVRELLELPSAEMAATRHSDDEITQMEESIAAAANPSLDPMAADVMHTAFHILLAKSTGNALMGSVVEALHGVELEIEGVEFPSDYVRATEHQHREILDAVRDRDATRARQAMIDHLAFTASVYRNRSEGGRTLHPKSRSKRS